MHRSRTVQIVCADRDVARHYLRELERGAGLYDLALAVSPLEAQRNAEAAPVVMLLDESALQPGDSIERAAGLLCKIAPLVVVGSPERQTELDNLITSGLLDFVSRSGDFAPVAAGLLERHMRQAALHQLLGSAETKRKRSMISANCCAMK